MVHLDQLEPGFAVGVAHLGSQPFAGQPICPGGLPTKSQIVALGETINFGLTTTRHTGKDAKGLSKIDKENGYMQDLLPHSLLHCYALLVAGKPFSF